MADRQGQDLGGHGSAVPGGTAPFEPDVLAGLEALSAEVAALPLPFTTRTRLIELVTAVHMQCVARGQHHGRLNAFPPYGGENSHEWWAACDCGWLADNHWRNPTSAYMELVAHLNAAVKL